MWRIYADFFCTIKFVPIVIELTIGPKCTKAIVELRKYFG